MYIKVDKDKRVIEVYENSFDGLVFVDWEPIGSLMDDRYVYKYKYTGTEVINRTQKEMDDDYADMPVKRPTPAERLTALEEALTAAKILLGVE